ETHAALRRLRRHIDQHYPNRMLLAEANQWPEDAAAYFGDGDECHMVFHFPLMPRLFIALRMEDRLPILDILEQTPRFRRQRNGPSSCAITTNSRWRWSARKNVFTCTGPMPSIRKRSSTSVSGDGSPRSSTII